MRPTPICDKMVRGLVTSISHNHLGSNDIELDGHMVTVFVQYERAVRILMECILVTQ